MRYFKNKFFLICLTVALCLTVFSVVLSASGHAWFLKDALNVISTPFRSAFNYCADGLQGFIDYFTEFDRISKENEELRKENEELKKLQADLEVLREENAWLRDFLDIKNQNLSFDLTDAIIIGKNSGASHRTLTLNKGSLYGIEAGMVVIAGEGLVGHITEVGLNTCEVVCISDASSSAGALVERSAMVGIIEGYYDGNCRFLYTTGFSDASDIAVGDTIISSGKGSIYPYGIKIGTVFEVQLDDASRSVIATVEPSVDFDSLSRVMIIKSYTVE
ncbi:MAG: rod shape-determining protein MreC [Clostridia bacterium]|nr:rod shape-determining protein MreC [Clostridia bacterium]